MKKTEHEKVKQSIAKENPDCVEGGKFNIARLMRKKGHIK